MPDSAKRRFGPFVLVTVVALLGGVFLLRSASEPLGLVAGVTALCLSAALGVGLVSARGRRRRTSGDAAPHAALEAADTIAGSPVPAETELDVINEHASTRVLQLQVRSLVSALTELQDLGLDDLRGTTVRDLIDNAALSQGRALVTVRALHDVLANQPGAAATGRVEAALTRLGGEAWFERPALTRRPGQTYVTFASPPHVSAPEHGADPAASAVEPPDGDPGTTAGPDVDADAGSDIPVTAPADRRVLPVPAPAPVVGESRSRRRKGRISTV
jgi:hypothetical protein